MMKDDSNRLRQNVALQKRNRFFCNGNNAICIPYVTVKSPLNDRGDYVSQWSGIT